MEDFYRDAISMNQSFWAEADIDTRFESGDQTVWNEVYGNMMVPNKRQFSFNRIRPNVNVISGSQRKNRKSITVVPIENGDQKTADQFTKIIFWASSQESILETISESFHGALVTGMNLLHVWLDFREDPISGNIKVENCSYNSFLIDPYFKKADLSDCNGIWKRSFLNKEACLSLWPDNADVIEFLQGDDGSGAKGGKFQFMPESYNFSMKNLLTYDEFYYRTYRTQKKLIDVDTGINVEWKGSDEDLKNFLNLFPQLELIEQMVPTVNLAVVIQGKVIYDGDNPLGIDTYPFVPVFCYYNPQMPYFPQRIQGVVRNLRDPQYLFNRRLTIELDSLESTANTGYFFKENAVINPTDLLLTGQGRLIGIKDDAQMTDIQKIMPNDLPAGAMQLTETISSQINLISGINEELVGSAEDDKAGILSMLRQGASLTTLQPLFDSLDRSIKILGRLLINVIQNNFSVGKVERILNEQPTQEFYDKTFGKYDAAVEEGLNTTTQKQLQFAKLIQLKGIGVPIPEEALLEAATIPNKGELLEQVQARQQQIEQQQQEQHQAQIELQRANINLADSRAHADYKLGDERDSRIPENRALAIERLANANKEDELAELNKIKAIKELEDLDIVQLEKLLRLMQLFKFQEDISKKKLELDASLIPTSSSNQENSLPEQNMSGLGK